MKSPYPKFSGRGFLSVRWPYRKRIKQKKSGTIMPKTVGILGGMGPKSTIDLMRKIVENTPAQKDQEHIRMLVDNRPQIPDRTRAILGQGPSPLPMLRESAQLLEKWGAQMIAIPCNTAHHFIDEIQKIVAIPVLNMIKLLSDHLHRNYSPGQPILLLATSGSLKTNLFQKYLNDFELIIPPEHIQNSLVMEAIYGKQGIKAIGNNASSRQKMLDAIDALSERKPICSIAGCTEIGIALKGVTLKIPVIDPLDLLAKDLVERAFQRNSSN